MTTNFFQENAVQLVKERADIVEVIGEHVNLQRTGINLKGCCPFHSEKTPSFFVHPGKQLFKCYGCGEGGDVLAFVMKYRNLSFPEALADLARRYNVVLEEGEQSEAERQKARQRERLFNVCEKAAAAYHDFLLTAPQAKRARDYLAARGMDAPTIATFRIGYAPEGWDFLARRLGDSCPEGLLLEAGLLVQSKKGTHYDRFRDRVIFPIHDHRGHAVGFGGRIIDKGEPKYLNTPETLVFNKGQILFGFYQNQEEIRKKKQALVVEGNFDLLMLAAKGMRHAVAPLGTALTARHVKALKACAEEIILLFDGDAPGMKAALRTVPLLLAEKMRARVVVLPDNHDPDSFIRAAGVVKFQEKINNALDLSEFVLSRLIAQHGLALEGKAKIVEELRPFLDAMEAGTVERALFISHFSERLGLAANFLDHEQKKTGSRPDRMAGGSVANVRDGAGASERPPDEKCDEMPVSRPTCLTAMPRWELQILQFAILYPEYLDPLLSAGMKEVIKHRTGGNILQALREAAARSGTPSEPETLLDALPPGPERTLVAETLINLGGLHDDNKELEAAEKCGWIENQLLRKKKADLVRQIGEAQQRGDFSSLFALMAEKKQLDQKNSLSMVHDGNDIISTN